MTTPTLEQSAGETLVEPGDGDWQLIKHAAFAMASVCGFVLGAIAVLACGIAYGVDPTVLFGLLSALAGHSVFVHRRAILRRIDEDPAKFQVGVYLDGAPAVVDLTAAHNRMRVRPADTNH